MSTTDNDVAEPAFVLPGMRVSYERGELDPDSLAETWHAQLQLWLDQAIEAHLPEPNAMVLATADAQGRPSSRTVLAKGLDDRGLVFFTNYTSAKSHDLSTTRFASATFPWIAMQRQATVRGPVERLPREETAQYWRKRPRDSQLGAWASPQSTVVEGRGKLDSAWEAVRRQFGTTDEIPVPPHWGGWRIRPEEVEFWQGRPSRLHDRLRFRETRNGWRVERLAP